MLPFAVLEDATAWPLARFLNRWRPGQEPDELENEMARVISEHHGILDAEDSGAAVTRLNACGVQTVYEAELPAAHPKVRGAIIHGVHEMLVQLLVHLILRIANVAVQLVGDDLGNIAMFIETPLMFKREDAAY